MVWVKVGSKWVQRKKRDIGMLTPSQIKARRAAFERKKLTAAFKTWRRKKLIEQKRLCYLCKTPMTGMYSVDHIKPLARGGTSSYSNLALAHIRCNRRKGILMQRNKAPASSGERAGRIPRSK